MIQVEVQKNKILTEDIDFGIGAVSQTRGTSTFNGTKVNAFDLPFNEAATLGEKIAEIETQYDYIIANTESDPSAVPMTNLIRIGGNDLVNSVGGVFTPRVRESSSNQEGDYVQKLWVKIITSTEHHLKRGASIIAKFNPVTGAQIFNFDYTAIAAALGLGTTAFLDHGTTANKIVKLDGSAKLPAVDGSLLLNLPIPPSYVPIGMPMMWLVETAPTNYLLCNGQAISRVDYDDLFNVIGTTFGIGDGSTTFQLPDFRGEFLRGWDNGRGIDASRVLGSSQADMLKEHTHNYNVDNGAPGSSWAQNGFRGVTAAATSSAGGVETRPRNIAINYIIRYQ
jgi:microcystin-dependent protein